MYGREKIACITRMRTSLVIIVDYICLYIFKEIKKYCVLQHNGDFTLLCEILSIGKRVKRIIKPFAELYSVTKQN